MFFGFLFVLIGQPTWFYDTMTGLNLFPEEYTAYSRTFDWLVRSTQWLEPTIYLACDWVIYEDQGKRLSSAKHDFLLLYWARRSQMYSNKYIYPSRISAIYPPPHSENSVHPNQWSALTKYKQVDEYIKPRIIPKEN